MTDTNTPQINPALKRFVKVLIGGALAGALAKGLTFLTNDPTAFGNYTIILTAIILGLEKLIPNNF